MTPQRAAAEERAAQEYADAIRSADRLKLDDWSRLNHSIIERWSVTALYRIKRRAWQIAEIGR